MDKNQKLNLNSNLLIQNKKKLFKEINLRNNKRINKNTVNATKKQKLNLNPNLLVQT